MVDDTSSEAFTGHIERFQTFADLTSQKAASAFAVLEALKGNERRVGIRPDIYESLTDPNQTPTVTFLGAGNGAFESKFLGALAAIRLAKGGNLGDIEINCEDVAAESRQEFLERIKQVPIDHHTELILEQMGLNIDLPKQDSVDLSHWLKGYDLTPLDDSTYKMPESDLAVLSHAIYYLKNWRPENCDNPQDIQDPSKNPLLKIKEAIHGKGGVAVFIHQNTDSQNYFLRQKFNPKLHEGQEEISAQDLQDALHALDIWTVGAIIPTFPLDVSSLFNADGGFNFLPNPQGKQLLSFIFRKDWDDIDPTVQTQIAKTIQDVVLSNRIHAPRVMIPRQGYQGLQMAEVPVLGEKPLTHFLNMRDVITIVDSKNFDKHVHS